MCGDLRDIHVRIAAYEERLSDVGQESRKLLAQACGEDPRALLPRHNPVDMSPAARQASQPACAAALPPLPSSRCPTRMRALDPQRGGPRTRSPKAATTKKTRYGRPRLAERARGTRRAAADGATDRRSPWDRCGPWDPCSPWDRRTTWDGCAPWDRRARSGRCGPQRVGVFGLLTVTTVNGAPYQTAKLPWGKPWGKPSGQNPGGCP